MTHTAKPAPKKIWGSGWIRHPREMPKMTHEDYENQVSAISVIPKKMIFNAPPPGGPRGVNSSVPNTPAKPVSSTPRNLTQEYDIVYSKPPAGIPVEEDPNKGTGYANYCKTDIISTCTCPGKRWADHKACKYAYKASNLDRCESLMFDEFCDNLAAQKDAAPKKTLTDCMGL